MIFISENQYRYMAKSIVFAKNKLSNGLKGYLISRALVQGCSILESASVKKLVSVKIGNFTKIGIGISMLFLLEEKNGIGIGMLFTSENRYR